MSYKETIGYLFGLQKYGMKFGLDNITKLLAASGEPQSSFHSIHVAGTNGKGSTSAMIASVLREAGMCAGLFTSPHLVSFTERIRVNGEEMPEKDVVVFADRVRGIAEGIGDFSPTFFEVVTTMAFLYFREKKVDWAVVETGLGGRLDATNIIMPMASVITSIGYDHCEFLGKTLKEITGEKAGIIKCGVPVITADQAPESIEVIERRAAEKSSPLYKYGNDFSAVMVSERPDGIEFSYQGSGNYSNINLHLAGAHQMMNASMAIKTIEVLSDTYPALRCHIRSGIEQTIWPGRLEMVSDEPPIVIDGAHNPQAARVLSAYLQKILAEKYRRVILVAGMMGDKDIAGMLDMLLPVASEIIFTAPAYGRAATPDVLCSYAASQGYTARTAATVSDAITRARGLYQPGDIIVITGSFYTIGEAKEALGDKGVLPGLRE